MFHKSLNVRGGQAPALRKKNATLHRRAWALACHTCRRAGSPRHASRMPTIAGDRPPRYGPGTANYGSRGTGPRATVKETALITVGRGPVPRHAWVCRSRAGTEKNAPFTVGRGPVPRQASRNPTFAGACPPRYGKKTALHRTRARPCSSGSPDPEPFMKHPQVNP